MSPLRLPQGLAGPAMPRGFDPRRMRHKPGPRRPASTPQPIDAETVIARLEEAGRTLLGLPRGGPAMLHRARHHFLADALAGYRGFGSPLPYPPAARIARMDQALAWILHIPEDPMAWRRVVGCRCLVSPATGRLLFGWGRLARLLGTDIATVRRWHAEGIATIVATLTREQALICAWDRLR